MSKNDKLRQVFREAFGRFGPPNAMPEGVDTASVVNPYNEQEFFPDIYCDYVDTEEKNTIS